MKKRMIVVCAIAVTCVALAAGGTAYAFSQVAENNAIGTEAAQNFAFIDANILPQDATVIKNRFDYDDGEFVYEIDFLANGSYYEYVVRASDGAILEREQKSTGGSVLSRGGSGAQSVEAKVTSEEALNAVLADAGMNADDIIMKKNRLDYDDGVLEYDIEFYVREADGTYTEYDYNVNAVSGAITERSMEVERHYVDVDGKYSPGGTASAASTAKGTGQDTAAGTQQTFIGVDEAKKVALQRAGLDATAVRFTKAKLDDDGGRYVYEIEFYANGIEYETDVDALNGQIREYSVENKQPAAGTVKSSLGTTAAAQEQSGTAATTSTASQGTGSGTSSAQPAQQTKPAATAQPAQGSSTASTPQQTQPATASTTPAAQTTKPAAASTTPAAQTTKPAAQTPQPAATPSQNTGIGADAAKSAAAAAAGVDPSLLNNAKVKTDTEDGQTVYEIEFKDGRNEYEIEISADSGQVVDYDVDYDDDDDDDDDHDDHDDHKHHDDDDDDDDD